MIYDLGGFVTADTNSVLNDQVFPRIRTVVSAKLTEGLQRTKYLVAA